MLAEAAKVAQHNEIPLGTPSRTQPTNETALAAVLRNMRRDKKWSDEDVCYVVKARVTIDNVEYGFPAFSQTGTTYRLCGFYQIKTDQVPANFDRNQVLFTAMSKKKVVVKYTAGLGGSEFHPQTDIFAVEHSHEDGNICYIYMQPDLAVLSSFFRRFIFVKLDQLPSLQFIHGKLEVVLSPSVQLLSDLVVTNGDATQRINVSEELQSGLGRAFSFNSAGDLI